MSCRDTEGRGCSTLSFVVIREDVENRDDVETRELSNESLEKPESAGEVASGPSLFVRLNIRPMRLAADLAVGRRLRDLIDPGMLVYGETLYQLSIGSWSRFVL